MRSVNIKGCNRIQEILILHKLTDAEIYMKDIEIAFKQNIEQGKGDNLWYGGKVVSISYCGYDFVISADGEIRASLLRKNDNLEMASVNDKYSNGEFKEVMSEFIHNDARLHAILQGEDEDYVMVLDDNNWYELTYIDDSGKYHDLECALDSSTIYDAISEAIGVIPGYIDDIEKGII